MAAPLPQDGLASQLPSELFDEVLTKADVPTLLKIKGVSRSWRAGARRVLRARLCRREGQPVPTSRAAVTDVDIEPFVKADGPGVAHVGEAMAQFPNVARMHAHGFVVDVAAVRGLGPAPVFNYGQNVLQPVRGCIGGEGEPPGGLLLAVRAARYGEAHVPRGAFYNCRSLTALTLPAGFTEIGEFAFFGCSSLTTLTLPASLTTIGNNAFDGCSSLTTLTLPASLTTIDYYAFSGCSSLTTLTLPAGLTTIGYSAFYGCSSLTTLTLPASLTTIGNYAFSSCSSLTTLTLPASLTTIDYYAFSGCSSLTTLTLPASLTTIGNFAFDGCSSLTTLTLPAGLTTLGGFASHGCSSLTTLSLPASLATIGNYAFDGCSSLTTLTLVSDHAKPRVLTREQPFDTAAVQQALEQARAA